MLPTSSFRSVRFFPVVSLLAAMSVLPSSSKSQGLIPTMLQQITRLEVTLQEAKQGYAIVQKGLSVIGDIKQGNFNLHNTYFSSLSSVKTPVKTYVRIADVIQMQLAILDDCRLTVAQLSPTNLYTAAELAYCSQVFAGLAEKTGRDMDELTNIISDGVWQMTDDQRIARIDALYKSVTQKYTFCQSFCNQARALGTRRSSDLQSFSNLTKLY